MIENSQTIENKHNLFKSLVLKKLSYIKVGQLIINDCSVYQFGDANSSMIGEININNENFYKKTILYGSIGAAESYIDADWSSNNLTQLLTVMAYNQSVVSDMESGFAALSYITGIFKNLFLRNHISRSKKNILAHYDLGNEFFRTFLDDKMQYSCGLFKNDHEKLNAAQLHKIERICEQLEIRSSDHVLEIGSGWGELAIYIAEKFKCEVTTTTISDQQYLHTLNRVRESNLINKIHVLKKDYRQLKGQFDKLVSIEMIEAVGPQYFKKYFKICNTLLKNNGKFLLQAITIKDSEYHRYRKELDFIKAYIFPGGCLPSFKIIKELTSKYTSLKVVNYNNMAIDYDKTLELWESTFAEAHNKIAKQGFDDKFIRMFHYYFSYCRAGFITNHIDTHQILFVKS